MSLLELFFCVFINLFTIAYIADAGEDIFLTRKILKHGYETRAHIVGSQSAFTPLRGFYKYLAIVAYSAYGLQCKAVSTNRSGLQFPDQPDCRVQVWDRRPKRVVLLDYPYRAGKSQVARFALSSAFYLVLPYLLAIFVV